MSIIPSFPWIYYKLETEAHSIKTRSWHNYFQERICDILGSKPRWGSGDKV